MKHFCSDFRFITPMMIVAVLRARHAEPVGHTDNKKAALMERLFVLIGWSWWDSNPRPNRETIRFLHAYSGLRFSCCNKTQTTNCNLIP